MGIELLGFAIHYGNCLKRLMALLALFRYEDTELYLVLNLYTNIRLATTFIFCCNIAY